MTVLLKVGEAIEPYIDDNPDQGETFLPGQIFVFGGFALRAIRLVIWSGSTATPLATRSGSET